MIVQPDAAWERAGARCAAQVSTTAGAVVVLGHDRDATAAVALGLARALGRTQRVALADLLGDAPLLRALLRDSAAPGISDSFLHGVSLNRIATPAEGSETLFVLPSGGGAVATPEVLGSRRWERLARGFREVDARLVLAIRVDADGAESLAQRLGGAVVVGPDVVLGPDVPTLAVAMLDAIDARLPDAWLMGSAAESSAVAGDAPAALAERARAPVDTPRSSATALASLRTRRWMSAPDPRRVAILSGVGAVAIALGALLWRDRGDPARTGAGTVALAEPAVEGEGAPTAAAALAPPPNPEDSVRASRFAVELMAANTLEGARLVLRDPLPAGTIAPAQFGASRAPWFRVVAGAFPTRREADSLLLALVGARRLQAGIGRVLEVPLAFVLQEGVARDSASAITAAWVRQGVPAYSLVQDDGRVTIFAGAFERLAQGVPLLATLVEAHIAPVAAYRLGRMF